MTGAEAVQGILYSIVRNPGWLRAAFSTVLPGSALFI